MDRGYDAENVRVWEEQMKNMAVPVGGDIETSDGPKKTQSFGFMEQDVLQWEQSLKPKEKEETVSPSVPEPVGSTVDNEAPYASEEFMEAEVKAWEEAMIGGDCGCTDDGEKEEEKPEKIEMEGYMAKEVGAWESNRCQD